MNSILHHSAIKQSQTEMMQYFLITDNNKHIIMFMWMHLSCSIMFMHGSLFCCKYLCMQIGPKEWRQTYLGHVTLTVNPYWLKH